jgi:hypothetical protein
MGFANCRAAVQLAVLHRDRKNHAGLPLNRFVKVRVISIR